MNNNVSAEYLIIGGGAAGCIVAKRLAERTSAKVVLIEAGHNDEGDDAAIYLDQLDQQGDHYDWGYVAKTVEQGGYPIDYARAKMLGGCANHNDCAFLAPLEGDLERWRQAGASGWDSAWLNQCLQRLQENIHIESSPVGNRLSRAFIESAVQMGLPELNLRQSPGSGTGWFPLNVDGRLRQSSSVCYLHPLDQLPDNLQVITDCSAHRLLFKDKRICAVETDRGIIHVTRETVLCAGSINTPQLLMLSGIGAAKHLQDFGINVVGRFTGCW